MKVLALLLTALLTSHAWAAKKYSPPSSLDYSVEVKAETVPESVPEQSTATILEKEMGVTERPLAVEPVDSNPAPSAASETVPAESKIEAADKNLREDQIPVLKEKEKPAEASATGFFHKVVAAVAMVLFMILGLAFTTRKYFQKHGVPNKHTNIRVITQHSLGAKKSLSIISVAGEYILLGVTDHNINLIKTLSLMDDEIPEQTPAKFNAALKNAETRPDFVELTGVKATPAEAEDSFSIRNIKEVVSQKLRGMKEFS